MWWKWILRVAVAIGQTDWARDMAIKIVDKLRTKVEEKALDILASAGALPETNATPTEETK